MAATARTRPPVRNRIGWRQRLARLGGSPIDLDLRGLDAPLDAVARLEPEVARLSDAALTQRAGELRAHARAGTALDELQPELFALAREASGRTLGLRPFDVQVVAALALARSRVVEMQTGEGKTLAAVMPAALHALSGYGVHVLTFNDYLARRDADWMEPVYRMLGLSVAAVQQGMAPAARRRAYRADVTYVTAKEAGFDHLRDLRARDPDAVVHRPFHMALVDEADSLLIDEARTPLVLAGRAEPRVSPARPVRELPNGGVCPRPGVAARAHGASRRARARPRRRPRPVRDAELVGGSWVRVPDAAVADRRRPPESRRRARYHPATGSERRRFAD